jgi:hypothetical protein
MTYTFPNDVAYVDVTGPSEDLQNGIAVSEPLDNPQSLAYSTLTQHLYMLQNDESTTGHGDLVLNKYTASSPGSYEGWTLNTARMTLSGFGHGTAFGVWNNNGQDWFFTECDADSTHEYRGTGITAFPWQDNKTYTNHAPDHHYPATDLGTNISCAVDPNSNYIAIRYNTGIFGYLYNCYGLSDFFHNGFMATELLNGFPEDPADSKEGSGSANAFQGFTVAGHYLYTISQATPPTPPPPPYLPPQGQGHFRSYDLNHPNPTSGYYHAVGNNPASSVIPGEYEGLCLFYGTLFNTLGYMVTSGGHTHGSGIPYQFNLHVRT